LDTLAALGENSAARLYVGFDKLTDRSDRD
jgi:hypothetical protein